MTRLMGGATAAPGRDRVAQHLARIEQMPAAHRRLRASKTVPELFSIAAAIARQESGFSRALVVTVDDGTLTGATSEALAHADSDRLRRQVQAAPVALFPKTLEYDLVRGSGRRHVSTGARPSLLADALELHHFAIAAIAPDGVTLALLVVDRPDGDAVDALDRATVTSMAAVIGVALEHLVLHARITEVASELRHLSASTQALMTEVLHAPVSIPSARGNGYAFTHTNVGPGAGDVRSLLTEREVQIATLLVEGRSNREIAERLILSPETVKDYVARLRRKLNAANRVEAAARYLQLVQRGEAGRS